MYTRNWEVELSSLVDEVTKKRPIGAKRLLVKSHVC